MSSLEIPKQYAVLATASAAVSVAILIHLYQKWKINRPPNEWELVGKVTQLYIYPLKSGKRIPLKTAECTKFGLKQPATPNNVYRLRDRELVVYNAKTLDVKTAKTCPKLVLIEIGAHDQDHFILFAPGMETLYVKIPKFSEETSVWLTSLRDEKIRATDCGDDVAEWLSRFLAGTEPALRLAYSSGAFRRNIEQTHTKMLKYYPSFKNEAAGLFSNITSYNILNERSVEDLRSKIGDDSVTLHNFRPTIVVSCEPFEEDAWDWVKINDAVFRLTKPCTRCTLTTVNQETGETSRTGEPLRTLRKYRYLEDKDLRKLENNSPVMGCYFGIHKTGFISVGDEIYAHKSPKHIVIHK